MNHEWIFNFQVIAASSDAASEQRLRSTWFILFLEQRYKEKKKETTNIWLALGRWNEVANKKKKTNQQPSRETFHSWMDAGNFRWAELIDSRVRDEIGSVFFLCVRFWVCVCVFTSFPRRVKRTPPVRKTNGPKPSQSISRFPTVKWIFIGQWNIYDNNNNGEIVERHEYWRVRNTFVILTLSDRT